MSMLLENRYYKIVDKQVDGMSGVFHISILPDCDVYRGHFPGEPVCPGVCNIETIKECAMLLTGKKLLISTIKQCRLTTVATPTACPNVDVTVQVAPTEQGYTVVARIADAENVYMEYKGNMVVR